MLPLYDPDLDTQTFNIFQPLVEKILPFDLPKLSVTTATEVAAKPATIAFKKPEAVDTYCKACKKKFSNEPTYTNHLKSAKHIVNEKKAVQPTKTAAAPTQRIAVNPQVQDALSRLDQAQDPKSDPTLSITIYWNQAQLLFALKRPQYVEKALKLLIDLLVSSPITTFSSAQITSFFYNSRLALARLLCIYQALDESRSVYLDALDGKWKLEKAELLNIAKSLNKLNIPSLLNSCDTLATKYLTRERNRTKLAPALTDSNNSITIIVNEAANLFAQENSEYETSMPTKNIAIVLYATCSLVCQYEKIDGVSMQGFYFMMSQVYESLDGFTHRIIEIKLLDTADNWNMFNALLLSVEIDDLVRANKICTILKREKAYIYPDVKILCDLCQSKTALDHLDFEQELDCIKLLLDETDEALLIRERSQQEQSYVLDRIRDLI